MEIGIKKILSYKTLFSIEYIEEQKNERQIKRTVFYTSDSRQMLWLLIQIIENDKEFQLYIIFGCGWLLYNPV